MTYYDKKNQYKKFGKKSVVPNVSQKIESEIYLPRRIKLQEACRLLDITRSGLEKLLKKDPTFPVPMKSGSSKQSGVFFDYNELIVWYENHREKNRCKS